MSFNTQKDEFFMQKAYEQALLAYEAEEVPIGAVLVDSNDEILASSYNQSIALNSPMGHAEIIALNLAAEKIKNYRLVNTKLYVTLEPCIMCFGTMIQARVSRLIYACDDTRVGILSRERLHNNKNINHNIIVDSGVFSDKCGELLRDFFRKRRR